MIKVKLIDADDTEQEFLAHASDLRDNVIYFYTVVFPETRDTDRELHDTIAFPLSHVKTWTEDFARN